MIDIKDFYNEILSIFNIFKIWKYNKMVIMK